MVAVVQIRTTAGKFQFHQRYHNHESRFHGAAGIRVR